MPIDYKRFHGIRKIQRNIFSAVSFEKEVSDHFNKSVQSQELIGPFEQTPIPDLRFSPLMSVPKDGSKRRVIVDFSYPPGRSVNDGISKTTYLDFQVEFCLPSVESMVCRLNVLGIGCLLYKRDLKGAFRQFRTDPGDYIFAGAREVSCPHYKNGLARCFR